MIVEIKLIQSFINFNSEQEKKRQQFKLFNSDLLLRIPQGYKAKSYKFHTSNFAVTYDQHKKVFICQVYCIL